MSIAERVLSELEEGRWSVGSIAPSFQRRLKRESQTDSSEKNISELCLAFYGKAHLDLVSVQNEKKEILLAGLSTQVNTLLKNIFLSDYPNSQLIEFENEISKNLQAALENIEINDSVIACYMKNIVTGFCRVSGVNFRSASHPQAFGIIFLGDGVLEQNEEQLAVSIVHEYAHQELFLINLIDRLVNREFDYNEVHAPFQGKRRPPIGRLHSLWALYRMVQFQKKTSRVSEKYLRLLSENILAFEENELTPFGESIVNLVRRRVNL